jgi:tRNA(Glu) U13 pseudouridine synthase TruD
MRIINPLPQQFLTTDPGVGGRIKARPEDFLVDELPLYEPEGKGEHLYLGIRRAEATQITFDRDSTDQINRPIRPCPVIDFQ